MKDSVPKAMAAHHQAVVTLTDAFCRQHLDDEYAALARRAVAALCRKRPSPIVLGHAATWACGVLYALGQANFLTDKSSKPSMSMQALCAGFGVGVSTGGNKAKLVRDALGIKRWDHRWLLPSRLDAMPMVWMVEVEGFTVDARGLPRPLQVAAYEHGAIPYVPADGPAGDGGIREAILARYDEYRRTNTDLQTDLATRLWTGSITPIALRLGLIEAKDEGNGWDLDDLAPAADLALYAPDSGGKTAVHRYAAEKQDRRPAPDQKVLGAMCATVFSIFRVDGCHRGAGVDLTDLISGQSLWVVDRGLEASAFAGVEVALRLFRPDEFWMTTGVAIQIDKSVWRELETVGVIRRSVLPLPSLDREALAETLYRVVAH